MGDKKELDDGEAKTTDVIDQRKATEIMEQMRMSNVKDIICNMTVHE
jgi:hypothetical protein